MSLHDASVESVESVGGSSRATSEGEDDIPGRRLEPPGPHDHDDTPDSLFENTVQSGMPPPSSSASPRQQHARLGRVSAVPTERVLPSRDVTPENIVDAYALFILYCNPYFPLDIDTSDLKRIFQTIPRSDGKDFDVYTLWELVRRFDSKDIKTWTQLALELGVEPPTVEKGGSVQKVQQYSVRLKRWMRAMHVDAFFEYLLDKRHPYYLHLPPLDDPHPAGGRDGVPADEDLAIRALDPSFRPKRGRKRNETPDPDPPPRKKPLLTTSFSYDGRTLYAQPQSSYPASAIPLSARPENVAGSDAWEALSPAPSQMAPHSAITTRLPQHVQWPLHGPQDTPITPHPMSAIEPRQPASMAYEGPQSAVTMSRSAITISKSRRKHGPAVSSAWNGGGAASGSKTRGRPPGNRSVQDGPYTTFPADPNAGKSPSSQQASPAVALMAYDTDPHLLRPHAYTRPLHRPPLPKPEEEVGSRRPERGRLSLQVPEHTGGPVHLATPTVVVNDESNDGAVPARATPASQPSSEPRQTPRSPGTQPQGVGLAYEALKRVVAVDLLKAELSGRSQRLLGGESMRLADAILQRFGVPRADSDNKSDDALRISATSWLGVSRQLGFASANPCKEKDIVVHRFAVRDGEPEREIGLNETAEKVKEKFDVSWTAGFGGVGGKFCIVGLETGKEEVDPNDPELRANQLVDEVVGTRDNDVNWKDRFLELALTVKLMKGQLNQLQDKVLDAML